MGAVKTTRSKRLAAIAERLTKASPGPWVHSEYPQCLIRPHVEQIRDDGRYTICSPVHNTGVTSANMEFIAHARQDVPWLLAKLRKANDKIRQLKGRR